MNAEGVTAEDCRLQPGDDRTGRDARSTFVCSAAAGCTVAKPQRPTQRGRQRSGKPAPSCVAIFRVFRGGSVLHGLCL